jgi:hypothetical protein
LNVGTEGNFEQRKGCFQGISIDQGVFKEFSAGVSVVTDVTGI